jgi:hypothetical protein
MERWPLFDAFITTATLSKPVGKLALKTGDVPFAADP